MSVSNAANDIVPHRRISKARMMIRHRIVFYLLFFALLSAGAVNFFLAPAETENLLLNSGLWLAGSAAICSVAGRKSRIACAVLDALWLFCAYFNVVCDIATARALIGKTFIP